jgi:hypothetical protein
LDLQGVASAPYTHGSSLHLACNQLCEPWGRARLLAWCLKPTATSCHPPPLTQVNTLGEDSEEVTALGKLLYEAAMLESGFILEDPKEFTKRVQDLVRSNLGVSAEAEVELDNGADDAEEAEEKAEASDDKEDGSADSAHDEL